MARLRNLRLKEEGTDAVGEKEKDPTRNLDNSIIYIKCSGTGFRNRKIYAQVVANKRRL